MNDYLDPINSVGMPELADSAIALEFLLSAKTGVRNYAIALTESSSPEVRTVLANKWILPLIYMERYLGSDDDAKAGLNPITWMNKFRLDLKVCSNSGRYCQTPALPWQHKSKRVISNPTELIMIYGGDIDV